MNCSKGKSEREIMGQKEESKKKHLPVTRSQEDELTVHSSPFARACRWGKKCTRTTYTLDATVYASPTQDDKQWVDLCPLSLSSFFSRSPLVVLFFHKWLNKANPSLPAIHRRHSYNLIEPGLPLLVNSHTWGKSVPVTVLSCTWLSLFFFLLALSFSLLNWHRNQLTSLVCLVMWLEG